jgi:enoyl-CoA hydratase/carnithine racemase
MAEYVHVSMPAPGVGQMLIDVPPRNVLDPEAWAQVEAALDELMADDPRVVVLASALEGYFVAHGSLDRIIDFFSGRPPPGDPGAQQRVMRQLDRGPTVSIAAVDGQAWGGGAELCWACDLRVASDRATFAQPEVNIGLTPGWGGVSKVAHLAGEAAALRLALDGRPIGGEEAHRLGLVHRLVPSGHALAAAIEWATWLAGRPPWALAANKQLVKDIRGLPLRDALRKELETFAECAVQPGALDLVRQAQGRYDDGADSYGAFQVPDADEA